MQHTNCRLYACGGAAANIAKELYRSHGAKDPGFAELNITFVDTSRSNIPKEVKEEFYHIQGMGDAVVDGSGKVRDTNYKAVTLAVPDILHRYKAGDINIVLHSASGG